MVFCLYVCGPLACLVPFEARGRCLDLELQMVVSHLWVLDVTPRSSRWAACALNCRAILQPNFHVFQCVTDVAQKFTWTFKEAMLYSACWLFLLIFQFLRMFLMITLLVLQYENFGSGGARAPIAQWLYMLGPQACVGDSAPCWYPKGGNSLLLRFFPTQRCY